DGRGGGGHGGGGGRCSRGRPRQAGAPRRGRLALPHRDLSRPRHRRAERDRLGARRGRDHGDQLLPHRAELSQQERAVSNDLPRGRRGHHRPRAHRFRLPHRCDDEEQLGEVDWLVGEQGVGSFKYYMFYKGLNLTSDSTRGSAYTMAETYDLGHLYLLMRQVAAASLKYGVHGRVSLSLHCEQAELIRVFIEEVKRSGPGGLEGYHRSRPPL